MDDVNISQLNHFRKVLAVQEEYNLQKRDELTNVYVHRAFIYPKFHISIKTLYLYLNINAKRQIRLIEEKKEQIQKNQKATSNV